MSVETRLELEDLSVPDGEYLIQKACADRMLIVLEGNIEIFPHSFLLQDLKKVEKAVDDLSHNPLISKEELSLYKEKLSNLSALVDALDANCKENAKRVEKLQKAARTMMTTLFPALAF